MQFGSGEGVLQVSPDHPLVAPFRRSIETGKPPGTWRYMLCQESEGAPHVIGAFALSPGGRIIFFPGGSSIISTDDPNAHFTEHRLDHIALDPSDLNSPHASHVAIYADPGENSRGLNYRSSRPADHLFPWMSLLLPNLDGLPTLPRILRVTFAPPRPDLERFGNQILEDGGLAWVPAPEAATEGEYYLQFDVWVGRGREWERGKARVIAWAYIPEVVRNAPWLQQSLEVRRLHIKLEEELGLVLMLSRPRGKLQGARILRPTLNFDDLEMP